MKSCLPSCVPDNKTASYSAPGEEEFLQPELPAATALAANSAGAGTISLQSVYSKAFPEDNGHSESLPAI